MTEYSGFSQTLAATTIYRAQSGDMAAMETIYSTYSPACLLLAKRMLNDASAAQDIVHSVFVKVIHNIHTFNHVGAFAGWIRQIVINDALAYMRKHAMLNEHESHDENTPHDTSFFDTRWWEACNDLDTLTQRLNPQARAILFLYHIEGYSHKEIGALFNKSESFSKQSVARSLTFLKQLSSKQGV